MNRQVCFSHGQESGPWGTKIRALAEVARDSGWNVESLDYRGIESAGDRVTQLLEHCRSTEPAEPMILVGSSMGGYVAVAAAARYPVAGLFLLAPALYIPGYEEIMPAPPDCPTTIVHGWHDDVVPCTSSVRYGAACAARLILVDGGHRLTENLGAIARYFQLFLDEADSTEERS